MLINDSEVYRDGRGGGRGGKTPLSLRRERERCGGDAVKVANIPVIEDDYRAVKKDPSRKMSPFTLKYLKDKGIIRHDYYSLYKVAAECPEYRNSIPERNVIEHVNCKLIDLYEIV